jgi:hypothetical protein
MTSKDDTKAFPLLFTPVCWIKGHNVKRKDDPDRHFINEEYQIKREYCTRCKKHFGLVTEEK